MAVAPATMRGEQSLGLSWLFAMRGPRSAPAEVVVVAIDRESAQQLGLSEKTRRWPRSLHAELVENLTRAGARVIVFDVMFDERRSPEEDARFAEALQRAGNIVLFEYLQRTNQTSDLSETQLPIAIAVERQVPPIPELATAAVALAPFPLPRESVRVDQAWIFKAGAGDTPTLPAVAFQLYAAPAYPLLRSALTEVAPKQAAHLPNDWVTVMERIGVSKLMLELREALAGWPEIAEEIRANLARMAGDGEVRLLAERLVRMYSGANSLFLDFYGEPRSITTIPYHWLVGDSARRPNGLPVELQGKAVFVGYSAFEQPHQKDGFFTVFSRQDGLDLSGVECAATTFGNLLEGRSVQPLERFEQVLLIGFWGFAVGVVLMWMRPIWLMPASVLLATVYVAVCHYVFAAQALWMPLLVPLLIQLPLALIASALWQYRSAHQERLRVKATLSPFLPDLIARELENSAHEVKAEGKLVWGICLDSDAEQYTQLSESMTPPELHALLNAYYGVLFASVKYYDGWISDVVGDAMLAVWAPATPSVAVRAKACEAAVDILSTVRRFQSLQKPVWLPTRIGIHCGELILGSVGAGDHFEYRAVGDTVNTANRIQSLNKRMGTRILASADVVDGVSNLVSREIGSFCLPGKKVPIHIYELMGRADELDARVWECRARFSEALSALRDQRWQDAERLFQELVEGHSDGPARFYCDFYRAYQNQLRRSHWDGVIHL